MSLLNEHEQRLHNTFIVELEALLPRNAEIFMALKFLTEDSEFISVYRRALYKAVLRYHEGDEATVPNDG